MKRLYSMVILLFATIVTISATGNEAKDELEDGKWKLKGVSGLNMSQTSFTNWSAGGDNAVAGNLYLNGSLIRKKGNWLWDNSLALEYGLTNTKSDGTKKAADRIELATQIGYSTDNKWFYTAAADFKTQFDNGYNYPRSEGDHYISKFMAPAYSNLSVGIEFRPRTEYSIYFSPAAGKFTFVRDNYLSSIGAFGVDPGDKFRAEFGAYLKAKGEKKIMENVTLLTSADFFTAYNGSFGNVDVNWDVMISMKINKFLSATFNTTLKYDDDVKSVREDGTTAGPKVQFKEVLGVGLAYNF